MTHPQDPEQQAVEAWMESIGCKTKEVIDTVYFVTPHGLIDLDLATFFHRATQAQVAEARDSIRDEISRLDWMQVLDAAIKSRPTSWRESPVFEYRNASDEIQWAVMRACYVAGIFTDPWKQAAQAVAQLNPQKPKQEQ